MKLIKRNITVILWMTALAVTVLLSGCSHPLTVKNLNSYTNLGMTSLEKNLSIGIITQAEDIHCDKLVKGVGEALGKYSADVILPYNNHSSSRKVDVVANISVQPEYKGSGWNFLVNFPGFLVFAPAWNGYIYKVNYNVDVVLTKGADKTKIDSFNFPINLNVRHAAINRTWTEVSWFEVGVIAFVGGIVFTQYDDGVSPLVAEKVKIPIGDYIAQEIISRINNSGKFAYMIRKTKEQKHQMFASLR